MRPMAAARRGVALAGSARDRFAAVPAAAALLLGAAGRLWRGTASPRRRRPGDAGRRVMPTRPWRCRLPATTSAPPTRSTRAPAPHPSRAAGSGQPSRRTLPAARPSSCENVTWQSLQLLAAQLPAGTPAGWYDLTVRDPRGRSSTAVRAFQSLGEDTTAPVVRIRSPLSGSSFAVGASVPIVVVADDGHGRDRGAGRHDVLGQRRGADLPLLGDGPGRTSAARSRCPRRAPPTTRTC